MPDYYWTPPSCAYLRDLSRLDTVRNQLAPGERVVWEACPDPKLYYDSKKRLGIGALLEAYAAQLTGEARRVAREPRSLYYVVTDRRAAIHVSGPIERVRWFHPRDLEEIRVRRFGGIWGDVRFGPGAFLAVRTPTVSAAHLRSLKAG